MHEGAPWRSGFTAYLPDMPGGRERTFPVGFGILLLPCILVRYIESTETFSAWKRLTSLTT